MKKPNQIILSILLLPLLLIGPLQAGVNIGATGALNINNSGAALKVDGDITNNGTLSPGAGTVGLTGHFLNLSTFIPGTSTIKLDGPANQAIATNNDNLYNLVIDNTGSPGDISVTGDITLTGKLTVNSGHLRLDLNNNTFVANSQGVEIGSMGQLTAGTGSFNIYGPLDNYGTFNGGTTTNYLNSINNHAGGIFNATTATTYVSGTTWTQNGTFSHNTGTVQPLGAFSLSITGSTNFNTFNCSVDGKTISLDHNSGQVQTFASLNLSGLSGSNINLQSTLAGDEADVQITSGSISYASIQDVRNTLSSITVSDGTDNGNNDGFTFGTPPAGGSISGTVTNSGGSPVSGATVALFYNNSLYGSSTTTAADGSYTFSGISDSGLFTVWAMYEPGSMEPAQKWVFMETGSETITSADITLIQYSPVSGSGSFTLGGTVYFDFDHNGQLENGGNGTLILVTEDSDSPSRTVYGMTYSSAGSYSMAVAMGGANGATEGQTLRIYVNGRLERTISALAANTSATINLEAYTTIVRRYTLSAGWNLVSFPMEFTSTGIETVLSELISASTLAKVLTFTSDTLPAGGRSYINDPSWSVFNDLSDLDHFHAYWIKMSSADTLLVEGNRVDPSASRALSQGWNFVGYWLNTAYPLPTSISETGSIISSIFDNDSLSFMTSFSSAGTSQGRPDEMGAHMFVNDSSLFNLNDLDTLEVGAGYMMYMNSSDTLTYNHP